MKRRSLLTVAATAGLAGCTAPSNTRGPVPDSNTDHKSAFDDYKWRHRISGGYLNVSDGMLYGDKIGPEDENDQFTGETGSGDLFSLDLQNSNLRWTQGFSGSLSNIVVKDAVYYETADDAANSWVSAIEFDGTRRWRGPGHVTPEGRLEHVTENAVYVSDEGLKALDPNTGDLLWKFAGIGSIFDTDAGTTAETASVYGVTDSDITALNVGEGEGKVQWRYESNNDYTSFDVSDGVVYAANNEAVVAIADGEERWRVELSPSSSSLRVHGVASDLVLAKDDSYLYAVADGQKQWEREMTRHRRSPNRLYEGDLRIYENRIYSGKRGEQKISAFKLDDGTELWSTDVGSEIESWEIVSKEQFGSEESVFVQTSQELQRVNPDGEITRMWTPRENPSQNEQIYDFVVDENVIVSTYSGTYALES